MDEERRIIATTAIGQFQFLYSLYFKLSKYKQKCQGTEAAKNHKNTHINWTKLITHFIEQTSLLNPSSLVVGLLVASYYFSSFHNQ
jgi:hypothetical protein